MNVYAYIFTVAVGILSFTILLDAKCACLKQKATLSEQIFVARNECSINLKSRRIVDRQLCRSWSKLNVDLKRNPKYMTEQKCCTRECSAGTGYTCEEHRIPIGVTYNDVDEEGRNIIRPETIHISVACVCVAPRAAPEPPQK